MRRIKLNDRVTFPHYLDLNSFIYGDAKTDNNNNGTTTQSSDPDDLVEEDGMEGDSTEDISDDELMSSGSSNGKKQKKSNGHNGVNGTHAPAEPDFEGPPTGMQNNITGRMVINSSSSPPNSRTPLCI